MKSLHVVQVNAAPGLVDQLNDWYDRQHIPDVLSIPGIVSARRYQLADYQLGRSAREYPYKFLTLYELEGDPKGILTELNEAIVSGRFTLSPALDRAYAAPLFTPRTLRVTGSAE